MREYIDPQPLDGGSMVSPPIGSVPLKEMVSEFQKRLIIRALEQTEWVQKDAADLLGVKPTTLNEMIKRYGIREVVRENA